MNREQQTMNRIFHIISNTHWDREWRFPYQRNRQMLVDMIDAVLQILETEPEYRAFHLDSQSIVLKDYLEIKPQNRDRIINLTKENRLLHGPWYILPEEFQVGGENLVRNLLLGHKTSHAHGGVSKIGYSPFSWGQISQLPQIYKEFNIDLIMFYRGINALDSPKAEFMWEGADGTRMLSSRFSTMPRYNFYFYIYRPAIHNQNIADVEHRWGNGATLFHFADKEQHAEDYFIISPHKAYYPENIKKQVLKIIHDQADDFTTPHVIWMEGHDSSGPNRQTVDIIKDIKKKFPELDVRHSTLEDYAQQLAASADKGKLKLVKGERRSTQNNKRCGNLFGYTTSARMYLKQANFDAERWIQYYAEPFNIFSGMLGREINDRYPETAWELIVQNSAHDSIGGCSLDRIHDDMMMRYKHATEISKGIFERTLKHLLPHLNTSVFKKDDKNSIYITAVNPCNFEHSGVIEAFVDIPKEMDTGHFNIQDADGNKLGKDIIERKEYQPVLEQMINRPMFVDMVRYHVHLQLDEVPAFGLKAFRVMPASPEKKEKPMIAGGKIENIIENKYLKVEVLADGSLNVTDKENDIFYGGIAYFEDHGDAGHAWVKEEIGPVVNTKGSKALVERTFSGEVYNEICIEHKMLICKNIEARMFAIEKNHDQSYVLNNSSSSKTNDTRIHNKNKQPNTKNDHRDSNNDHTTSNNDHMVSQNEQTLSQNDHTVTNNDQAKASNNQSIVNITLRAGLGKTHKHLTLNIKVNNTAESHRLRLMLPTKLQATHSHGEGQFDVAARSLERPDTSDWIEQPMYDYPMHHFVDVSDGKKGLALLVEGLKEYEVLPDKDKTLAITLFRTFEYKINPAAPQDYSHEKGAQMLGESNYRLALYPHSGDWQQGEVYKEAFLFNYPPRLVQTGKLGGGLGNRAQLMKLTPETLVFSTLKKPENHSENAFILRIFNPTGHTVEGKIEFLCAIKEVQAVTLEEIKKESLALTGNHSFKIKLDAKKIATYIIKYEPGT